MSFQADDQRNPYQQAGFPPSEIQKRSGSRAGCIFAVVAGGALLVLLCCGGVVGVGYFGLSVFAKEIETRLRDNPVLVEHLGPIESFEMDMIASIAEGEENVFVFNVKGQKGSGIVTAQSITADDGSEEITWAQLRLPDGQTVDLLPNGP